MLTRGGELVLGALVVLKDTPFELLIQGLDAASEVVCNIAIVFDIKTHDINRLIRRFPATDHQISIINIVVLVVDDGDRLGGLAFLNGSGSCCGRLKLDVLYLEVFFTDGRLVERVDAEAAPRLIAAHPVIDRWQLLAVGLSAAAQGRLLLRLQCSGAVPREHDPTNELKALHGLAWRLQGGDSTGPLLHLLLVIRSSHRHRHVASRRRRRLHMHIAVHWGDAGAPSNHSEELVVVDPRADPHMK